MHLCKLYIQFKYFDYITFVFDCFEIFIIPQMWLPKILHFLIYLVLNRSSFERSFLTRLTGGGAGPLTCDLAITGIAYPSDCIFESPNRIFFLVWEFPAVPRIKHPRRSRFTNKTEQQLSQYFYVTVTGLDRDK